MGGIRRLTVLAALWGLAAAIPFVGGCAGNGNGGDDGSDDGPIEIESGANDKPSNERMEIAFLQYGKKGDWRKGEGNPGTTYLLMYTRGWIMDGTFGGPFEPLVKRDGIQTSWKEIKHSATQSLYAYLYKKGFFELPGEASVDWTRFRAEGYWTKVIALNRDGQRHIVFVEDVRGDGTDPRWNTFIDCEKAILSLFSNIEDVRPVVNKDSLNDAFKAYMKRPK